MSSQKTTTTVPEILAPAGNWECARAAIENGADAIYFGLDRFNARMRADNFALHELPDLMDFLHLRGVRGYVTFNTLVFTEELDAARDFLVQIISSSVDAAIVQDVGICRLIREISPDFPIHTSTQMTVTSAAGVRFAQNLGANLTVIARENSLPEIDAINKELDPDAPFPLETFVHGALCVAYSGQCLTSEALGGRSANRGECAQACRMKYELIVDDSPKDLGNKSYLLSPQDLAGLELIPQLIKAGIHSLKIEGRLKSPEYVANITRAYRNALDHALNNDLAAFQESVSNDQYAVEMAFSRGLHTGWLQGIDNQVLVHARFGKKRGVLLGRVRNVTRNSVWIDLQPKAKLKPGDGVVFENHLNPDLESEQGGPLYQVNLNANNQTAEVKFARNFNLEKIQKGNWLWKTGDPALDKEIRQTFAGEKIRFHRPIDFLVSGEPGSPLIVQAFDPFTECTAQSQSSIPLVQADDKPLTSDILTKQLSRLGNTPFKLRKLTNHIESKTILPFSELNRLKREVVLQLESARRRKNNWSINPEKSVTQFLDRSLTQKWDSNPASLEGDENFTVTIRHPSQLEPVINAGIQRVYCEFEDPKKYQATVEQFRQIAPHGGKIFLAPPRIHKPGEEWILKIVESANPDGFLIRNFDHLEFFNDPNLENVGDFSLNVANPITADYFLNHFNLSRLTLSYDLSSDQVISLAHHFNPDQLEVTIHQRMPMFHMEHCVFCAFLSSGKDYRDCGRPCENHQVQLKDRVGELHYLRADAGCRNTLYNSRIQTGAEEFAPLQSAGISHFRIDFLAESPNQISTTLQSYSNLKNGSISGQQLWKSLKLTAQLGVTRGQFLTP